MHDPSFTTGVMGLTVLFLGLISYRTKALDLSGTLASVVIGLIVILLGNVYTLLALLVFLVSGIAATKYRFGEKVRKGFSSIEERTRSVGNVLGNGLAVVVFLIIEAITKQDVFWAATFSAIATVNGDTLASELGKIYGKRPRLITNLKPVKPGTNGGVSLAGELFALLGVLVIIPFALPLTRHDLTMTLAILSGGFIGINADSFIGATLENRGFVNNNGTNFLASLIGGLVGALVFYVIGG